MDEEYDDAEGDFGDFDEEEGFNDFDFEEN